MTPDQEQKLILIGKLLSLEHIVADIIHHAKAAEEARRQAMQMTSSSPRVG